MTENGAKKRERLFDLYSRHITLYEPDKRDIFACPLCLRAFTREALVGPDPYLSLAHIIPEKLGGTACTLCCTPCNNEGGKKLEAALMERFRADDTMAGMTQSKGRFTGPFGDIGVEFKFSPHEKAWSIYAIDRQSNPATISVMKEYLRIGPAPVDKFHLEPRYRNQPAEVRAAIYQSALLLMFSYFGYEFLFHSNFAALREQVAHPQKDILPSKIAVPTDTFANAALGRRTCAVMFGSEPSFIFVLLRLRPKAGSERAFAVALPGLDNTVIPSVENQSGHGCLIPYRPEALYKTKGYFRKIWRYTREETSPDDELAH